MCLFGGVDGREEIAVRRGIACAHGGAGVKKGGKKAEYNSKYPERSGL
jgi:hypothetical protein